MQVLKKYVMKSDRFPNSHVLATPHGYIGACRGGLVLV